MLPPPTWLTHAASLCIGAASGAMVHSSWASRDPMREDGDEKSEVRPTQAARPHSPSDSMPMLPRLPIRMFQPNDNLVLAFDTRNKNPLFAVERLAGRSSRNAEDDDADPTPEDAASRKRQRFREEGTLLPYHRARNQHYRHSGYDRGHLAPAADFSMNERELRDTFVLSNVSPQRPRFNRSAWLRLEEFARHVAREEGCGSARETWVITGPLWLPGATTRDAAGRSRLRYSYAGLGTPPSVVAVPTHFFKVVAVIATDEHGEAAMLTKFAAFVLPNSDFDGSESIRLVDFTVRLTDLETVTGLEFFPALLGASGDGSEATGTGTGTGTGTDQTPLRKEIADALTDDVRIHANADGKRSHNGDDGTPLLSGAVKERSKGRHKKRKQLLEENAPISLQHLCKENDACLKLLKV